MVRNTGVIRLREVDRAEAGEGRQEVLNRGHPFILLALIGWLVEGIANLLARLVEIFV